MGSLPSWRKAYHALHVCVFPHGYSSDDDASSSSDINEHTMILPHHSPSSCDVGIHSSANLTIPSSSVIAAGTAATSSAACLLPPRFCSTFFNLRPSISALRKSTCAICLETMQAGHGHALFTAECSHTFHFHCIASNVSYGNLICPVCRATWNEVPCQALLINSHHHHHTPHSHNHSTRSASSTYRNSMPHSWDTASSSRIGYGEPPSLIQSHELEQPQWRLYSFQPVLRRLDDSIGQLQSAQEKEKQMKADETEGGRYDDDEELLEGALFDTNSADQAMVDHLAFSSVEESQHSHLFQIKGVSHDAERRGRKAAVEITALGEETELPCEEVRESMAILIRLKGAGGRDEEKQLAKILQGRGRYGSDPSKQWDSRVSSAVDLVAVLDVSRSMEGTKLGLLKRTMAMIVRSLKCSDRLSIVAFAAKARRVMSLRRMTAEGKRAAMEAVDALACTGGTAIAEALRKATEILKQRKFRNPVATVILLSDARDGSTSPTSCTASNPCRSSAIATSMPSSSSSSSSSSSPPPASAARGQFEIPVRAMTVQSHSNPHQSRHGRQLECISEESNSSSLLYDMPNPLSNSESNHDDGNGDGESPAKNSNTIHGSDAAFAQSLGGLLSVVALRVEIEMKVDPHNGSCAEILGIELDDHEGGANTSSSHRSATSSSCQIITAGRHIRISLGDVYSHEGRELVVHVRVPVVAPPSPSSSSSIRLIHNSRNNSMSKGKSASSGINQVLMAVYCRYTDPSTGASLQTAPTQVLLHRYLSHPIIGRHNNGCADQSSGMAIADQSSSIESVRSDNMICSIEVDRQRNRLRAARAIGEAMSMAKGMSMTGALHCLEMARAEMQRSEATRRGDMVSLAIEAELERLQACMSRDSRRRTEQSWNMHAEVHSRVQEGGGDGDGQGGRACKDKNIR